MDLTIVIESEASSAAQEAVEEVLAEHGLDSVDVRRAYIRESGDPLPWLALILINGTTFTLATFFQEAIKAAAQEAGKEGWRVIRDLVEALTTRRQAQEGRPGSVTLRFEQSEVEIPMDSGLSEVAFRRMGELRNPSAPLSGTLRWDESTGQWVDSLKGRFICDEPACTEFATTSRIVSNGQKSTRIMLCDQHDSDLQPTEDH